MGETQVLVGGGAVWLARNSNREPSEPQPVVRLPAVSGDPAAKVRATYIELAEVPDRRAVLLSKPVWSWGAEMGVNDAGVAIGCDAALSRFRGREPALLALDLVRLGLERGSSAAHALEVIAELLEAHGQGGAAGFRAKRYAPAATFVIADAQGAFEMRTRGREHATRRLAATGVTGFAAMAARLREHRGGDEDPARGGRRDTCLHAAGLVRRYQTTGSMIARLAPAGATAVFTGTSAPCLSIFRPAGFAGEFSVLTPHDRLVESMLWRRHEFLHRRALADPDLRQRLRATRDPIEAKVFEQLAAGQPSAEQLLHADRLAAAWHKVLWESLPQQPQGRATRFWARVSQHDGIQ